MRRIFIIAAAAGFLTACGPEEELARPDWVELTREAAGHYCQMIVLDHPGPKAQIHLAGNPNPVWFSQVRDAIAFTRMPEEPKEIAAIYVSDMGKAPSWQRPGADNWIALEDAFFVVGGKQHGGMGAPETVPFANRDDADTYRRQYGGRVMQLQDVPDDAVFGSVAVGDINASQPYHAKQHDSHHNTGG